MRISGLLLLAITACAHSAQAVAVDYVADVKPLLRQHCYSCHGALR